MSRKRDKPYPSDHVPASMPKRRRPLPTLEPALDDGADKPSSKLQTPPALLVMGLSPDCSVLDLKSRFEIYGAISRTRIDRDGVGYILFRSKDSAESAMAASHDASFGITVVSKKVQLLWVTDPLAQWREGVGRGANKHNGSSSKLLRAEVPLRRHGRVNKLASAIVNPISGSTGSSVLSVSDVPFKGREIVGYDDIL